MNNYIMEKHKPINVCISCINEDTMKLSMTLMDNRFCYDEYLFNFARLANKFKSNISMEAHGKNLNAKYILYLFCLSLVAETEITIIAKGEDSKEAVDQLKEYLLR